MKFNNNIFDAIVPDFDSEDFSRSTKSNIQVPYLLKCEFQKHVKEEGLTKNIIKAMTFYIELFLKDHPEDDIVYYYFKSKIKHDPRSLLDWKIKVSDLINNFNEFSAFYYSELKKENKRETFVIEEILGMFENIKEETINGERYIKNIRLKD